MKQTKTFLYGFIALGAILIFSLWLITEAHADTNHVYDGEYMVQGEYIVSSNYKYYAILQDDCNFAIYEMSGPPYSQEQIWDTGTNGFSTCFAAMQDDGNFVVYEGTGPSDNQGYLWGSQVTGNTGNYFLYLDDSGILSVYAGVGPTSRQKVLWSNQPQHLKTGGYLKKGDYITSPTQAYFAIVQKDCNFAVYKGSGPDDNQGLKWSTKTAGYATCLAIMQSDGKLVIYEGSGPNQKLGSLWETQAKGKSGDYVLLLNDSGILTIYRGTGPHDIHERLWSNASSTSKLKSSLDGGDWCPDIVNCVRNFTTIGGDGGGIMELQMASFNAPTCNWGTDWFANLFSSCRPWHCAGNNSVYGDWSIECNRRFPKECTEPVVAIFVNSIGNCQARFPGGLF
jgi:hypothetical protein